MNRYMYIVAMEFEPGEFTESDAFFPEEYGNNDKLALNAAINSAEDSKACQPDVTFVVQRVEITEVYRI